MKLLPAVFVLTCLIIASCGGGGGGGGPVPDPQSPVASSRLFSGDDDFASLIQLFQQDLSFDPSNEPARVLLGVATFLDTLKTQTNTYGEVNQKLQLAGVELIPGASFWSRRFTSVPFQGQGDIPDSAPTGSELRGLLTQILVPSLEELATSLESASPGFSWFVQLADLSQNPLITTSLSGGPPRYEIDYGDLQALASGVNVMLGSLKLMLAYDDSNIDLNTVDPGDNPSVDPLEVIRDVYPNFGNVIAYGDLSAAKERLTNAFDRYVSAAEYLRGETVVQANQGILTLAPDSPIPPSELSQRLADELAFRNWAQGIVDGFAVNSPYLISTGPSGESLPTEEQIAFNFFRLFEGVNIRDRFFQTVEDPFDNGRLRLGVTDFQSLNTTYTTADGLIETFGGVAVSPGDLQSRGSFSVKIGLPPFDTKTIDGDFSDWGASNSTQIGGKPAAGVSPNGYDLGNIFVARDANNLYLRIDSDVESVALSIGGTFQVYCEVISSGQSGFLSGFSLGGGSSGSAVVASNSLGVEARLPLPVNLPQSAEYVEIIARLNPAFGLPLDYRSGMILRSR
jgi:hypothetical protein